MDRRDTSDRRRSEYNGRSREDDYRRSGDSGRDRDRDRDRRRDRERERDRDRDRDYYSKRDRDDGRRDERRHTPGASSSNGKSHRTSLPPHRPSEPLQGESEKEEGEISPRTSPSSAQPSSLPIRAPTPPSTAAPESEIEAGAVAPSAEETLAARRAQRQAILAKYAGIASSNISQGATPSPGPSSAVEPPPSLSSISDNVSQSHSAIDTPVASATAELAHIGLTSARQSASASPAPPAFSLAKEDGEEDAQHKVEEQVGNGEQVSAADYDPSLDRREDEQKRVRATVDDSLNEVEMIEEEEEEEDDLDDMFAVISTEKKKVKKIKKVVKPSAPALITTTLDSAADSEGYYQIILGEQLDGGRYQVFSSLGKGMFANVVRARVLQGDVNEVGKEVAIKIVRCQESMYKAGQKEVQILQKLKAADPDDKKHVVRLERTFEHRGHLCIVFESLSMNLRDVVKRFGKDVGLNIKAVRAYAHQLFLAMSLLRKCNIMHADIKPDNILVNEQKNLLKLCDLGSASDASENEITPYLVSRFYRAPEIILGVPYDPALDIWSIGCTLYELYTGKILFPGRSNNHMLLLMMELKGRFNSKMIKKAKFGEMFFDDLGGFQSVELDRATGTDVIRKVHITKPSRDIRGRLMPSSASKMKDDEAKTLTSFIDLLDKCLALDPAKRITPKEALVHPFIRG